MAAIKIRVFGADGKYRGGLFKDYLDREDRWMGAPKPNLQEVMVCTGPLATGSWYLLELVMPRRVSGEEMNDSLFDEKSRCCCRTPVQALFWFSQQAFGPPPALLDRVARFRDGWAVFCASASARSLLARASERSIDDDDPSVTTETQRDRDLLQSLKLVSPGSHGGKGFFQGLSEIHDMGVDGYIEWMNGHISRVSHLIAGHAKEGSPPRARSDPTGAAARSTRGATDATRRKRKNGVLDIEALALAHKWKEEGRVWSVPEIAAELGVDRSSLTGRISKGGRFRCPNFRAYWTNHEREAEERHEDRHARLRGPKVHKPKKKLDD